MVNVDSRSIRMILDLLLKRYPDLKYQIPLDKFSLYDFKIKVDEVITHCEVKNRSFESYKYDSTMIELSKFRGMQLFDRSILIVMFTNCYYVFNLKECDYYQGRVKTALTTSFENRDMVYKDVVFIDLYEGNKYEYV